MTFLIDYLVMLAVGELVCAQYGLWPGIGAVLLVGAYRCWSFARGVRAQ